MKKTMYGGFVSLRVVGYEKNKESLTKLSLKFDEFMKEMDQKVSYRKEVSYEKEWAKRIGTKCDKCEKLLDSSNHRYTCFVCQRSENKVLTWCKGCIDQEEDPDNPNPIHSHPLLFVPANSEALLNEKIPNIKPTLSKSINFDHPRFAHLKVSKAFPNIVCDNCSENPRLYNWSCSICHKNVNGTYDLCTKCFKISQDPAHEEYPNLKLAKGEHDPKTHFITRIPYTLRVESDALVQIDRKVSK